MNQIHSRQVWKLLFSLLLSAFIASLSLGQTPSAPPASPAPAQSPSPAPSPAPGPTPVPGVNPAGTGSVVGPPKAETPEPPEKVVLKIGNQQFTKAEIDAVIESLPPQTQQALAMQGKKQFGDYFELSVLLSKRAEDLHLDKSPEFERKLAFQKQQMEAQMVMSELTMVTPEDIEKYYNEHAADFDEIMVRQIVVRKKPPEPKPNPEVPATPPPAPTVRLSWVGSSNAAVRAALEKNPQVSGLNVQETEATFMYAGSDTDLPGVLASLVSAGVKISNFDETKPPHPNVPNSTGLSPEEATARAEAIRKALIAGADIKKLSEEYKAPGEVIIEPEPRKLRHGGMRPDMEKVAFALKDGEVSEPIDVTQALVLFQVTGHSQEDLKAATPEIERKLRQEKSEAVIAEMKKNTAIWMDDQYFAPPPKPQGPPGFGPPQVRIPPHP